VLDHVMMNYPRSGLSGDVYVAFDVREDGSITGAPRVIKPADETLSMLAVKSVRQAAPFPGFPSSIKGPVETFKIVITYK